MSRQKQTHIDKIVDQFSRQAIPFTHVAGHLDSIQTLVEMAGATNQDDVLDIACGPGLVACEFARVSKHVTGIDITSAMIERAGVRQAQKGLENVSWTVGDVSPLPFEDNSYSIVISRYSFHHFLEPQIVLKEMIRVCRPGGRVLVADIAIEAEKSAAFDKLEILRDPSHTHALTQAEFVAMFQASSLSNCRQSAYEVDIELEAQLEASFPEFCDRAFLREMITNDIGVNDFGIQTRNIEGQVRYTVPIGVFVGSKAQ